VARRHHRSYQPDFPLFASSAPRSWSAASYTTRETCASPRSLALRNHEAQNWPWPQLALTDGVARRRARLNKILSHRSFSTSPTSALARLHSQAKLPPRKPTDADVIPPWKDVAGGSIAGCLDLGIAGASAGRLIDKDETKRQRSVSPVVIAPRRHQPWRLQD
jgi:hypothetical protein